MGKNDAISLFQWAATKGLTPLVNEPEIFIKFSTAEFSPDFLHDHLEALHFTASQKDLEKLSSNPLVVILELKRASILEESYIMTPPKSNESQLIQGVAFLKNSQLIVRQDFLKSMLLIKCIQLFLAKTLFKFGYIAFWGEVLEQSCWILPEQKCHYHCIWINWKKAKYINKLSKEDELSKNFNFLRLDTSLLKGHYREDKRRMGKEEVYSFLMHHALIPNSYACELLSKNFLGLVLNEKLNVENSKVY